MESEHNLEVSKESTIDFRGNPSDKSRSGGWLAAGLILGAELSEKICVTGISMNLVTYLIGDLHLSTSQSANIVTNFLGSLNLLALLGGFVADAKLGRFLTTAIAASITAAGAILLTITTSLKSMQPPPCDFLHRHESKCVEANGGQLAMLFASLYTIAVGAGSIKANVSGFGSDQFDASDPKEEKSMVFFFNRFYFCVSFGSLFAATVLVYIQDNVGRAWGYGISATTMAAAVVVLLAGMPKYRFRRPQGSPLTLVWGVMWRAWRNRRVAYLDHVEELNGFQVATVPHTDRLRWLDKAATIQSLSTSESIIVESKSINQKKPSTVTQVEEVKLVIKLIPIWGTCILFWTIFSQMTTFSIEQATYMNRKVGSFIYPSGSLSVFLFFSVILVTALNEKIIFPLASRFTHNVQGITSLQRVGVGLIFSMISMVVAGFVEMRRREFQNNDQNSISVFWLVPQFCLVGVGEAYGYVGQLEFFIREAPERMKSMSTGLFISTISIGFFMSSVLVTLVDKLTNGAWIKNNLNKGRLDYFYWMLAVLAVLNFIIFFVFAKRHQYKPQKQKNTTLEDHREWNDEHSFDKKHGSEV